MSLVGRGPADYSDACVAGWLSICLSMYVSSSPSNLVSTVIARPFCNCLVKKINQGTDVFTHKHTELPASSFSIVPRSVCSDARMYEINYIDLQFLLLPNHKIKIAYTGQLAVGSRALYCKYTFLSFLKKLSALTMGVEGGLGGGGICKKMDYVYILTLLINIMLMDFHHLLLF